MARVPLRTLFLLFLNYFFFLPLPVTSIIHPQSIKNSYQDVLSSASLSPSFVTETIYFPGTPAPSFSLNLTNGSVITYNAPSSASSSTLSLPVQLPMIVNIVDLQDGFTNIMWADGVNSLDMFLLQAPTNITYLFLSYATTIEQASLDMTYLQTQIQNQMVALNFNAAQIQQWNNVLLYCATPISVLTNQPTNTWIPTMLMNWTSPSEQILINPTSTTNNLTIPRADSHYAWLPWPTAGSNGTLVYGGNACNPSPAHGNWTNNNNFNNTIALVSYNSTLCSYADAILAVQNAGASGVIIISNNNTLYDMNCNTDTECNYPLGISASIITYTNGQAILNSMKAVYNNGVPNPVFMEFNENQASGYYFGIDELGNFFELGWLKIPTLMFLGWQAQYQNYLIELRANLSLPNTLTIPLLNHTLMVGTPGAVANVTLPPLSYLYAHDFFELDVALGCPTPFDTSCAIWDRTLQLSVCCGPPGSGGGGSGCGVELGRWITPFRRGIGRWITDVTPLLPLLTTEECTFTMYTDAWAMPWYPSLNLRFRNASNSEEAPSLKPYLVYPLYAPGATFDQNFSKHFPPISFATPSDAKGATIVAVITGHGSDNNGCGEFCVTEQTFICNNYNSTIISTSAGTEWGCTLTTPSGSIPNEHGTWFYGRDFWCDGSKVRPWLIDISSLLQDPNSGINNTISYEALYNWLPPDPTASPGIMIHHSYIAFYK